MSEYIQFLYGKDEPLNFIKEDGTSVVGIIQHVERDGKLIMLINGQEKPSLLERLVFNMTKKT